MPLDHGAGRKTVTLPDRAVYFRLHSWDPTVEFEPQLLDGVHREMCMEMC
jgi:hypothetical protein